MKNQFVINRLHGGIKDKKIIHGLDLTLSPGKITVVMGPNGSGKSTLANILMGSPSYKWEGSISWLGKNVMKLKPHERAKLGLFLTFQSPYEIPGVNFYEFILTAYKAIHPRDSDQFAFEENLRKALKDLNLSEKFLQRGLNAGFSGGEKKKAEILQMRVLKPRMAILDEIDSGLDIDALKLIAANIKQMAKEGTGFLVITHYRRLLDYLNPDKLHIIVNGKIVKSGTKELVTELEEKGYEWITK